MNIKILKTKHDKMSFISHDVLHSFAQPKKHKINKIISVHSTRLCLVIYISYENIWVASNLLLITFANEIEDCAWGEFEIQHCR